MAELDTPTPSTSIEKSIGLLLDRLHIKQKLTMKAYRFGLDHYKVCLIDHDIDPRSTPCSTVDDLHMTWFVDYLQTTGNLSIATERLYISALRKYMRFLDEYKIIDMNPSRISSIVEDKARKLELEDYDFPLEDFEVIIEHVIDMNKNLPPGDSIPERQKRLVRLRDRAFILMLADTGLRIHEACALTRADVINWKTKIAGKGHTKKNNTVRFSKRVMAAVREYLRERQDLDGKSGIHLDDLPLFGPHDNRVMRRTKIKPMTTKTGRLITAQIVKEVFEGLNVGIHPHSFRHYFVTKVWKETKNIYTASKLARHKSLEITKRYAHEGEEDLDRSYRGVVGDD